MMEDDLDMFFSSGSNTYLASLIQSRQCLKDVPHLLTKLDAAIELELELALIGAQKAKSEVVKKDASSVVRPIK